MKRLARIVVVVDWNSHRWTISIDMRGVGSVVAPGWIREVAVLSVVDEADVGLDEDLWVRLLRGNGAALLRLEVEGAVRELLPRVLEPPPGPVNRGSADEERRGG